MSEPDDGARPRGADSIEHVEGRTAADVMHARLGSLPAATTVAEVRAWFAASASRRLATFAADEADGGRYLGALAADELPPEGDAAVEADAAVVFAGDHPTIPAGAPAAAARALVLASPAKRVPVLDADGRLVGVVALDKTRTRFCGIASAR
ncbi:MAG TPA: CBS domain-containing protein [Conexibacter sp.]|nr:CBS domain-containing protein [Conexibacter sp.]